MPEDIITHNASVRPVGSRQLGDLDLQVGRGGGDGLNGVDHGGFGLGEGTDDAHSDGRDADKGVPEELHDIVSEEKGVAASAERRVGSRGVGLSDVEW